MSKAKKVIYVDAPPSFFVKEGMFHVKFDGLAEFTMSPHSFRAGAEAARRVADEWDREQRAPVPFKRGE